MRRLSPGGQAARLLMVMVLLGLGCWLPSRAEAAPPESWLAVTIDTMSPALPERDGTVRLAGTIRNTSDTETTHLQAVLWRSLDPITDREGFEQVLAAPANEPLGSRVKPDAIFDDIPNEQNPTLAPGQAAPFDLTADVEEFDLPADDGVYLIGVQVRGRVDGGADDEILGRGRIFMPLVTADAQSTERADRSPEVSSRGGELVPQQLTSVVLLSSRPCLIRSGVLSDDRLAKEVGAGGRLRTLLSAASQPGASYAVDPATIEELETMRRGYQVLGPKDTLTPGTGSVAAARWLEDFARLRGQADGYRTLYGSPDLTALVHADQQSVIADAVAAGNAVETTRSLPLLVIPGAGRADTDTMAVAGTVGARAILVSESTARGDGPLLATGGATPVVSFSATALTGGPGPNPRRTAVKIRQRAYADSWLAANAADADDPAREVRLITTPAQAATVPGGPSSWLQPRTLSQLLAEGPAPWGESFAYGGKARDAELSDGQLRTVARLDADYRTYVDLFVDPQRAETQRRAVLPRAASYLWRDTGKSFTRYTDALTAEVRGTVDEMVRIVVTPRVQTTGRSAAFPITVRNRLPVSDTDPKQNAIQVVLRFDSVNSQRLTVEPIEIADLAAGASETRNAQVRAETNGSVQVTARLFTVSGRPLGPSEPILVNATQAGTIGWIIAIVAGVVLVGTTALRIRQVARERGGESDDDQPPTGATPAPLPVSRPAVDEAESGPPPKDRDPLDV